MVAATGQRRGERPTRGSTRRRTGETRLTPDDRIALGKDARVRTPRESHAELHPAPRDPVALLEQQATTRVPDLVPIRYGRMLASPFAFYRGAALVMASDLSATPTSGIQVQACGDAHLANFGGFASPERELVFDVNDFDETLPGPWEWDVKRLAASFAVAGRDRGFDDRERRTALLGLVRSYRQAMRSFARMGNMAVWYSHIDLAMLDRWRAQASARAVKRFQAGVAKARTKDSMRAFAKLTTSVNGKVQLVSDPPLIVPLADMLPGPEGDVVRDALRSIVHSYRQTLPHDRQRLLDSFELVDFGRKVVGVGSVGTRAWILLLAGRDGQDPLFLQAKEAEASVLEGFVGKSKFDNHGRRVVEGQRLMQSASDIFLGWVRAEGIDGQMRDFYVRQLWDSKASADIDAMSPSTLAIYGEMCGWTLARAHARSGDRIAIAAYLGKGSAFDEAIGDFAELYANQSERDYQALADAVKSTRVTATTGV
jgi:uncharacterized protein (DUF2252 family)